MSLEPQEILSLAVPAAIALLGREFHRGLSSAGAGLFRWNGVFCNVRLGEAVIESVGGSKNPSLLLGIA